jgi:hypothetical protein
VTLSAAKPDRIQVSRHFAERVRSVRHVKANSRIGARAPSTECPISCDSRDFRRGSLRGRDFEREANFVNTDIKGPTSFESAIFSSTPPRFSGAKLHEGTVWRDASWPLPEVSAAAGRFIDAYERLKLEMDRLKKHDDELYFFKLEMQSCGIRYGSWAPISEIRVLGRTIPISSLKIPLIEISSSSKKLFGLTFPTISIEARDIKTPGLRV